MGHSGTPAHRQTVFKSPREIQEIASRNQRTKKQMERKGEGGGEGEEAESLSQHHHEHVLTVQIGHGTHKLMSYLWTLREMDCVDQEGVVRYESGYHLLNAKSQLVPKCVMIDNQPNDLNPDEIFADPRKIMEESPWSGASEIKFMAKR
jgi:hypothetical protein